MYCVSCGVKLQNGTEICPLCGIRVYHPDISEEKAPRPYPAYGEPSQTVNRAALMMIVSAVFLIPAAVCFLIDMSLHSSVTWSGYVIGGIALAYVAFCLPRWFQRPNPVVFFPISMAAALLFMLYVCLKTGGNWFLSFAFPVCGALTLLCECVIVLLRYVARGKASRGFLVMGGAFMALGALMLLVEFLLHITFELKMLWWSLIPLTVFVIVGSLLLVIGLSKSLRHALHKKFFI